MRTFADWLRHYNSLNVAPGLEALQKMRAFHTEKGIDIFKDAVSMHSLLRGTIERGSELFSPCKKAAYEMLKEAVVGGQTLPRSWRHNDPPAPFQKPETLSAGHLLRRQRTVPVDDGA